MRLKKALEQDLAGRKHPWMALFGSSGKGRHPNETMREVGRFVQDRKGIVHFEFLKENETVDADRFCSQLDVLKKEI
ncbi:hypothetical protein TNCV_288461 [Trichonephila clavipes]|nr:hypothetical protein TNCV_288461 [Trichonephila clavipes]